MIKNKAFIKKSIGDNFMKNIEPKMHKIGALLVKTAQLLLEGRVKEGRTELTETIYYEIRDDELYICSDNLIFKFLHDGTKPHIIRPKKPGGLLAFRADQVVTRKDGSKINFGDTVLAKEVKHPGIEGEPVLTAAIFLKQKEISEILSQ